MFKLNKNNFNNAMAKKLYNPRDLAKEAGLSDTTISKIIKDSAFSSYKSLGKIAKALDVEPKDLIQE